MDEENKKSGSVPNQESPVNNEQASNKQESISTNKSQDEISVSNEQDAKKTTSNVNTKGSQTSTTIRTSKPSKKRKKTSKVTTKGGRKSSKSTGIRKKASNKTSYALSKTKEFFSKKSVDDAKKILSKVPSGEKLKGDISSINKKIEKKISSASSDISKQKTKLSWLGPYIELARLNRPIGAILLFLPLTFGMSLASGLDALLPKNWYLWLVFAIGAFSLRAAGCVWNDIIDKKFDKLVERTKHRPLASDTLSLTHAFIFLIVLMFIGFLVLLSLNPTSQIYAIIILPLVAIYPFTKRYTHFAQLFLGIVFNWGVWIGWFSILAKDGHSSMIANMGVFNSYFIPLFLYIGTIFWTIGYDTIYSLQDRKDDVKLGLKSLSILFAGKEKKFLYVVYLIFWLFIVIALSFATTSFEYFIVIFIPLVHLFLQVYRINLSKPKTFKRAFLANAISGLIILYTVLIFVD